MPTSLHSPEAYCPIGWEIIQDSRNLAKNTKLKRWHIHHVAIALLEKSEGHSARVLESIGADVDSAAQYMRQYVDELDKLWEQQAERIPALLEEAPDDLSGQMVTPTYGLLKLEANANSIMDTHEEPRINSLHLLIALTDFDPVGYEDYLTLRILAAFGISNESVISALEN